jgi:hypothetical protein
MSSNAARWLPLGSKFGIAATLIASACSTPEYNISSEPTAVGGATQSASGADGLGSAGKGGGEALGGAAGVAGTHAISNGQPTVCRSDSDCASLPVSRSCDTAIGICVECLPGRTECGKGLYCGGDKQCHVGCASNNDCKAVGECDTSLHRCTKCSSSAECPLGTQCATATAQCVPGCDDSSACPDGWACCASVCVNPNFDQNNCGSCGTSCSRTNAVVACREAICAIDSCSYGSIDCNGKDSDGCETDLLTDATNCGACGMQCNLPHATPNCSAGHCSAAICESGWKDCNGAPDDGCEVDIQTDSLHCGSCDAACSTVNGTANCSQGQCAIDCSKPYDNCDGTLSNGCETDLTRSVANCGACGTVCKDSATGTAICRDSECKISNCTPPYGDCDNNESDGCESNSQIDVNNCGGCGAACNLAHATAACVNGVCAIAPSGCAAGWADCNGYVKDGCETNLMTSLTDCGACGAVCAPANAASAICSDGVCNVVDCAPGLGLRDCNHSAVDGCEADPLSSTTNCGGCGKVCSTVHATPACASGTCKLACEAGFDDCDEDVSTGCETVTTDSAIHCGACNNPCSPKNGTGVCQSSACVITSCEENFADCDANSATGCEANLMSDPLNCKVCKTACDSTNGTATCQAGTCGIVCKTGFDDCNASVPGCETNILTDLANCGACGKTCSTTCVDGICATPCTGICSKPKVFSASTSSYTSPDLGTGTICYETASAIRGGNCTSFGTPNGLYVNADSKPCNANNWTTSAAVNGGYCIHDGTGQKTGSTFTVWP